MEVKVYGVHIKQDNSMEALMNEEFVKFAKSYGAAFVMNGKNPVKYLASFILPTREKQKAFTDALKKCGIKATADKEPAFVDKAYAEKYLGGGWFGTEEQDEKKLPREKGI